MQIGNIDGTFFQNIFKHLILKCEECYNRQEKEFFSLIESNYRSLYLAKCGMQTIAFNELRQKETSTLPFMAKLSYHVQDTLFLWEFHLANNHQLMPL